MTRITAEQQFKLRAKKALETGDASFRPRGEANKALFEDMKEELDKKTKEINLHTSLVGDRIIKEITPLVTLFNGSNSTNPQDRINARILQNAANNKANKEDRVLIREQKAKAKAEAKGKAKGKADHKSAASTASTAAPSEQMESDRDESMENEIEDDDIIEVPLREDDESSSDEEEPMLLAKPTPTPVESIPAKVTPTQTIPDVVYIPCKRQNADTKQQFEKIKVEFKPCTDAEKKKIVSPETLFEKVVDILKSCSSHEGDIMRFNRAVNNLPCNTAYKYCVDEKLQGNDTFSVVLLDIYTFEAVCKLSLV